jgi:two-component sensor histidine kinase
LPFPFSQKPVANLVRDFDWASTPLGPISGWPPALRTVVNLMLESEFPKAIVWGEKLITIHNDAFLPILGDKPSAIGRPFSDVWSEAWESIGPIAERAFAGESTFIEDFALVINRKGEPEQTFFTFCYSPIRDDDGNVVGMMYTVIETTATVKARRTELVLRQELVHRVKNMLAVTSSVVNSTLRHADSIEQIRETLGSRIAALAKAQDIVSAANDRAAVEDIVRFSLEPHVEDWSRVSISGPAVLLEPSQVTMLSLVLYELATNAVKYGALSSDGGSINVSWQMDSSGEFGFSWSEKTVRPVVPPSRSGFGSKLMTQIAPAYFNGEANLVHHPTGLRYTIRGRLPS